MKSKLELGGKGLAYVMRVVGGLCVVVVLAMAICACGHSPEDSSAAVDEASAVDAAAEEESGEELSEAEEQEEQSAAEAEEADKALDPAISQQVENDVAALATQSGMEVGVSVIDLPTGTAMAYQGDEPMVSASMIKLIIAEAFLDQVKAGAFSLDATYALKGSDMVGGTGTLNSFGVGTEVSYRDILWYMIAASDNTGTNILIRAIGMDAVNAEAKRLGLKSTQLNRLMMDYDAIDAGIENYTSANDVAVLLKMAYEGTFVDADSSALVVKALEDQEDWGGIRNGLPSGVVFAHKTGTLAQARHDGGIVEGEHPYVLVVLCGGDGFYERGALDVMAQIAASTYAELTGAPAGAVG